MKDQNFTASFTVDKTPEEVFKAIKNIRGCSGPARVRVCFR